MQTQVYKVDPDYRHADVIEADLGLWTLLLGDLGAARAHLERAVALNPDNLRPRQRLVALAGLEGDPAAARSALAALESAGGALTAEYLAVSYPFQDPAHAAIFHDGLRRAGVRL